MPATFLRGRLKNVNLRLFTSIRDDRPTKKNLLSDARLVEKSSKEEALIALLIADSLVSTLPDVAANVLRRHLVDGGYTKNTAEMIENTD